MIVVYCFLIQPAQAEESQPAKQFQRILFLGNSITLHGPAPKIGWKGNWGMAASGPEKDYVHLVTKALTKSPSQKPQTMVKNIATFERNYADYNLKEHLQDAFSFKPDLVILAIGENVPQLKSDVEQTRFKSSVDELLKLVQSESQPTIIVRSSFWSNPAKDTALKAACAQAGGTFVDISKLGKNEANYARAERKFEHAGVAAHPGDQGMQAIADAIVKAAKP
ncbi:MAG: SGNH/GDSL hydrolase family protein [Gimesia chilikensis]|uniref:SGNH/GDSL hydrolase family protein n=1 Tax=Gimesia chilikensis TaxID=2605989 RepID=UPI0037B09E1A